MAKKKEKLLSDKYKREMDNMTDKDLISVWQVYFSKAKRFEKHSYQEKKNNAIANYAMKLHKAFNKKSRFVVPEDEEEILEN